MRKLVLASVASTVLSTAAMAADMPAPVMPPPLPAFTWTGLYIGGNAGWASLQDNGFPFCLTPSGVMQGPGCTEVPGGQIGASGFIGGGQAGYNWQAGGLVLGIEADVQAMNLKGTTSVAGPFQYVGGGTTGPGVSFVASENLPWLGTLRGRFGVAFDRLLIYMTGGLSMGGLDVTQAHIFPGVQYASNASRTLNGYTFGGGMEWAFLGNWSIKAEGMYYDLGTLGTQNVAVPAVAPSFIGGKNFDGRGVIARAGVNFRFGEPFTLAAAPSY
jgi:outer membrane immunogenic protein